MLSIQRLDFRVLWIAFSELRSLNAYILFHLFFGVIVFNSAESWQKETGGSKPKHLPPLPKDNEENPTDLSLYPSSPSYPKPKALFSNNNNEYDNDDRFDEDDKDLTWKELAVMFDNFFLYTFGVMLFITTMVMIGILYQDYW